MWPMGLLLFYSILFYPIALEGCRDTTDEFATIPFHLVLFSAALVELAKLILFHSFILSFQLFFCLPFVLCPYTVPCRIAFAKPEDIQMWRNYLSFHVLTGSEVHHILQWLLGSFCKPPHWKHGPCIKCSLFFGSISFQRPVFFSLKLQSRAMIHRHIKI